MCRVEYVLMCECACDCTFAYVWGWEGLWGFFLLLNVRNVPHKKKTVWLIEASRQKNLQTAFKSRPGSCTNWAFPGNVRHHPEMFHQVREMNASLFNDLAEGLLMKMLNCWREHLPSLHRNSYFYLIFQSPCRRETKQPTVFICTCVFLSCWAESIHCVSHGDEQMQHSVASFPHFQIAIMLMMKLGAICLYWDGVS